MKSLDREFLERQAIPIEMGGLIEILGEFRGRQNLFRRQSPQVLESLRQAAIIESTESSNRIEGVTVAPDRFRELMLRPTRPRDRSEAEIIGYRNILSEIHITPDRFRVDEETIRQFHREIYAQADLPAGHWKRRDNTIEERLPDGRWIIRFAPVPASETPLYMKKLCAQFNRLWDQGRMSPLLLIPAFALDFLCIHPFMDGNGRVSRLLIGAYREFEDRVGTVSRARGAKTAFIEQAIDRLPSSFGIADIERACTSVSRDMIRVVLNRLRKEGKLACLGTGRNARWEKRSNRKPKRGNKDGNKRTPRSGIARKGKRQGR